ESSLQAKLEPGSFEAKEKLAPVAVVGDAGWAVIEVSGAVVSGGGGGGGGACTVQLWLAGLGSVLPVASVALTEKVCSPPVRAAKETGEEHELQSAASSLQEKVESGSEALKAKL